MKEPEVIPLPPPEDEEYRLSRPLNDKATAKDALKADLEMSNFMLDALAECWKQVSTISGVSSLVSSTIAATKHRRAILELPYGSPPAKVQSKIIDLLD